MKEILILFGGKSDEHDVSVDSGLTVMKYIDREKFDAKFIYIDKSGNWKYILYPKNFSKSDLKNEDNFLRVKVEIQDAKLNILLENGKILSFCAVFPMLHGKYGEDGTLQGLFEFSGIECIGSGCLSSALSMDKYKAHKYLNSFGINTPKNVLLTQLSDFQKYKKDILNLEFPMFVKPVKNGSSIGISEVHSVLELEEAVNFAFSFDDRVIVEEKITGQEIFSGIVGNKNLTVGELQEIEVTEGFLDASKKHSLDHVNIYLPARIDENSKSELISQAKKIYRLLDCKNFARVDFFLDENKKIYFNEVNTIPGFTNTSALPMMMDKIGINIKTLITMIIEND